MKQSSSMVQQTGDQPCKGVQHRTMRSAGTAFENCPTPSLLKPTPVAQLQMLLLLLPLQQQRLDLCQLSLQGFHLCLQAPAGRRGTALRVDAAAARRPLLAATALLPRLCIQGSEGSEAVQSAITCRGGQQRHEPGAGKHPRHQQQWQHPPTATEGVSVVSRQIAAAHPAVCLSRRLQSCSTGCPACSRSAAQRRQSGACLLATTEQQHELPAAPPCRQRNARPASAAQLLPLLPLRRSTHLGKNCPTIRCKNS